MSRWLTRLALAGVGAWYARTVAQTIRDHPRHAELERTNFHGRAVSLAGGPALATAATATAALGAGSLPLAAAAVVAGAGAGAVGFYDDVVGARPEHKAKGFRGHLSALRQGRVTSGLVKIAGVGTAALTAAALVEADRSARAAKAARRADRKRGRGGAGRRAEPTRGWDTGADGAAHRAAQERGRGTGSGGAGLPAFAREATVTGRAAKTRSGRQAAVPRRSAARRLVDVGLGAGVIAGTANLLNLLDLRPGRALKAGLVVATPLLPGRSGGLVAGPLGATAGLLRDDLDEQIMLGDTGANALGARLGLALVARCGTGGRAALLAGLAALTAASEKVSFTSVIEATRGLRELDALGRRTDRDIDGSGPDRSRFLG